MRRIRTLSNVSAALEELLDGSAFERWEWLSEWRREFPSATYQLLALIADDPAASFELAPAMFAARGLWSLHEDDDGIDPVLAAAFPQLTGAYRDAASDLPLVRTIVGIAADAPRVVGTPDPSWLWPKGVPFPAFETIEGVQARLNYLGLGSGPVTGEWNELTRRAFTRWQVFRGQEPSGELEYLIPSRSPTSVPRLPSSCGRNGAYDPDASRALVYRGCAIA